MNNILSDDELCEILIRRLSEVLPDLEIQGGAEEPFYKAATEDQKAILYFRDNYVSVVVNYFQTLL